jgi:hypothetical protein
MHHTLKQHSNSPKHTTEREAVIDRRALEGPMHRNQLSETELNTNQASFGSTPAASLPLISRN